MKSRFFSILLLINFIPPLLSFSSGWAATVIDIMLVYDTTATTWVMDNGGMATFSEDAVSKMNLALDNSGIVDLEFNLVHSMSIPYATSLDLGSDLGVLQEGDGDFAAVHEARDTYGADLVAMFVDTGSPFGYVGIGYLLTRINPGSPNYAFTVNAIQSVDISHTLTHEVGHNLGAHHSIYQDQQPGPNWDLGEYSAGWYFTGSNTIDYHTIMAYNNDGNQFYISAPLFSTPLIDYEGTVAGDLVEGDNARLLSETMATVADYRPSGLVCTFSITPSSERYEMAGEAKTVTITAADPECDWTVEETLDWVEIAPSNGKGSQSITVTVDPNEGDDRTGNVTIAGQSYSISQVLKDDNIFIFLPAILNAARTSQ